MPRKIAAGILMYRLKNNLPEFFLVHPGGPYFAHKDSGSWTIPKGEVDKVDNNSLLETAKREFYEETGLTAGSSLIPLGSIRQKSGKEVHAWAFEGDWFGLLMCKTFAEIEWPPRSGKTIRFPETDRAGFFTFEKAKQKINPAQIPLLERLKHEVKI